MSIGSEAGLTDAGRWDQVLEPRQGWFDLPLAELWRYRDLILLFVKRDFVAQFKQTVLGPTWFVLQPLLTTLMFTVVFGNIARLDTAGIPKVPFYLSGNILWLFFSGCLLNTADTLRGNAHIFGKVYFPRLAVPIAVVLSQGLRFGLQFVFFVVVWLVYAGRPGAQLAWSWPAALLPLLVLLVGMLGLGCGIIVSALASKYRDLQHLVQFGVQLGMYTTTVIYPLAAIGGGRARWLILANPMTPIIEAFRRGFLGAGEFEWAYLGYSVACAAGLLVVGVVAFHRVERTFMDTV